MKIRKKSHTSLYASKAKVELHAFLFALALVTMLVGSIAVSFASSGPIILGTELNANGYVEYMCLGSGCESLPQFAWND